MSLRTQAFVLLLIGIIAVLAIGDYLLYQDVQTLRRQIAPQVQAAPANRRGSQCRLCLGAP